MLVGSSRQTEYKSRVLVGSSRQKEYKSPTCQ